MANGTILVTVETGTNKRRKDEAGNIVETPYYTAQLGMMGTRATINVSPARLNLLKNAGLPAPLIARLEKAVAKSAERTVNDPRAATAVKPTSAPSSLDSF